MNWLLGKLKWLFVVAAIGGPIGAYIGWSDKHHKQNVMENGIEAVAKVESMTRSKRRRRAATYNVDLSWRDQAGKIRHAKDVRVSRKLAEASTSGDRLTVSTYRIKYLADEAAGPPILLADKDDGLNDFMMTAGGIGGGVGILGLIGFFIIGRRRQEEEQGQED